MSSSIWLARHGNRLDFVNPEWFNTAPRRYDPPLSDDGIIQAQELAGRLQNEQIDHLFASPFLRTIQTAHLVAEALNLVIKLEAGLGEWHNQAWMSEPPQIHPQAEIAPLYPRIDWDYRSQILPQYPENREQVLVRMKLVAKKLSQQFEGNILIVGHGISVVGIAEGLLTNDVPTIKASLCSLTKLAKTDDSNWKLLMNGETSFLTNPQHKIVFN